MGKKQPTQNITATKDLLHHHHSGKNINNINMMRDELVIDDISDNSSCKSSLGDDVKSSSGVSSTQDSRDGSSSNGRKEDFVDSETRAVFRLRMLVFLVLFLAASAVSVTVYIITSGSAQDEFETQFEGAANKVIETFENIISQNLGAISTLGVAIIAHGVDHSRSWPFVTLSSFQQRSSTIRKLSNAVFVAIAPVVQDHQRQEWENFVTEEDSYWVNQGYEYQENLGLHAFMPDGDTFYSPDDYISAASSDKIHGKFPMFYLDHEHVEIVEDGPGPFLPVWQTSPVMTRNWLNRNIIRDEYLGHEVKRCYETAEVIIGGFQFAPQGDKDHSDFETSFYASVLSVANEKPSSYKGDPMSTIYLPVFDSFEKDRRTVAVLMAVVNWGSFFRDILTQNLRGVTFVVSNTCDGSYTYEIDGQDVHPIGPRDQHDTAFSDMVESAVFDDFLKIEDGTSDGLELNQEGCKYSIHIYPSQQFADNYVDKTPAIITMAVCLIFVFTVIMFFIYDRLVERRQTLILRKATQTSAIVSSLFPENVRDRLMNNENAMGKSNSFMAPNSRLKSYLKGGEMEGDELGMAPIADLVPHATVLFADIAGFTAWSSTRDPAQVFILLQNVYQAFDVVAKRRRVFKVETIGDSYVAVTGLPEPQANHAVIMARFAGDCLLRMTEVARDLEVSLGPDTAELGMRFGIHSGPVTAGVLRGERARFQLFGDTVNTAARMESTGVKNKIQISQSTADLLVLAGRDYWVKPRNDSVLAKGKGVLNTFWLTPNARKGDSTTSTESTPSQQGRLLLDAGLLPTPDANMKVRHDRLVDWISELFLDQIKKIIAQRGGNDKPSSRFASPPPTYHAPEGQTCLDEVAEVIYLPKFNAKAAASKAKQYNKVVLDPKVGVQLHKFVAHISSMYRRNPFHNFEHASHVTLAVHKLIKRIATPDIDTAHEGEIASMIHDYTHGITSDELTIFAILFSALIHDVDHRGVSNTQLIKEEKEMASLYKGKSVAEQNSLDIAWELLMGDDYIDLRSALFANVNDLLRFRQVIVNVVLATDIFDKELNGLRKSRWAKAFSENGEQNNEDFNNLRGTIVIEHIIQASDVAHTMQHWHVYCKWNKRLFFEMHQAFRLGRMGKDPSEFWYQGELQFFDNYIIPLAKKLKDCNVFGVSSDECLNYALKNRAEWEERGKDILADMIQDLHHVQGLGTVTEVP